jgi:hypothetical protein
MFPEPVRVVIEKGTQGTTQRHNGNACWRFKPRHQPKQVADQNEETESYQERGECLAVMADNVGALVSHKSLNAFDYVLQGARFFDRKLAAHQEKGCQKETEAQ